MRRIKKMKSNEIDKKEIQSQIKKKGTEKREKLILRVKKILTACQRFWDYFMPRI